MNNGLVDLSSRASHRFEPAWSPEPSGGVGTTRRPGLSAFRVLPLLLCLSFIFPAANLSAQGFVGPPGVFRAPDAAVQNDTGLTIAAIPYETAATGNMPIRVYLKAANGKPLGISRTVTVQVEIETLDGSVVQVRQEAKIEKGAVQGSTVLLIPRPAVFRRKLDVTVFERGLELEPLRISRRLPGQNLDSRTITFTWLAVSDTMRPLARDEQPAAIEEIVAFRNDIQSLTTEFTLGDLQFTESLAVVSTGIHPDDMFDSWAAYSSFGAMFIELRDLRRLAESSPESIAAIREWWLTGTTLLISCGEDEPSDAATIEALLSGDAEEVLSIDWESGWGPADVDSAGALAENPLAADVAKSFKLGRRNAATVIVGDASQLRGEWASTLGNLTVDNRIETADRNGYGVFLADLRFNDLQIPGVGMPPVNTFRVLITLFVILIGPVNYFVLRRLRRLYLILLTVPLGAALVCISLLAYAMLGDGLAVKSRVLSFSEVDQQTEQVVSWSRQSYYAPFMPTSGYRFPEDSEVLPIVGDSLEDRFYRWEIQDGFLQIKGGNTGSRTTSQYLVTRSSASEARLEVESPVAGNESIDIVNELGCPIELVGIIDQEGRLFFANDVEEGASFTAVLDEEGEFLPMLTTRVRRNAPDYPEGLSPYYFRTSWRDEYVEERGYESAGRLGTRMQAILNGASFEPGTYWVVARQSPTFVPKATAANEISSFHVIFGRW